MNSRNDTSVDPTTSTALLLDHRSMLDTVEKMWQQIAPIQGARLRDAVRSVPEAEWSDRPRILLALAASHRSVGSTSHSAALPWFRAVATSIEIAHETPLDVRVGYLVQLAATQRTMGDMVAARVSLETARTLIEQDTSLEISRRIDLSASFSLQLGLVRIHLGDYDEAQFDLALAEGLALEHLSPSEIVECHSGLAFVSFQLGDFSLAERHVDLATQHAEGTELLRSSFGALTQITRFLLSVEWDATTREREALLGDLRVASAMTDWEPQALLAEAISKHVSGSSIEALDILGRVVRLSSSFTGDLALTTSSLMLRAEVMRTLGEVDTAREILTRIAPGEHHATCPHRVLALAHFVVGDPQAALDALADCLALGDLHSTRTMAQIFAIEASALADLGRTTASDIAFDRALLIAASHRATWGFRVMPREVVERLLGRAAERPQPKMVATLIERLHGTRHEPAAPPAEPLSERELVIVRHLATGATLSQIGAELFISVNTVKSHVRSIYRKLSSTNRREAIARAVELGLAEAR